MMPFEKANQMPTETVELWNVFIAVTTHEDASVTAFMNTNRAAGTGCLKARRGGKRYLLAIGLAIGLACEHEIGDHRAMI
jgi:hypothetical protein